MQFKIPIAIVVGFFILALLLFNTLSAGGTIEMPIADQLWGDYYGSFKDKFGVQWLVNYTYPKES